MINECAKKRWLELHSVPMIGQCVVLFSRTIEAMPRQYDVVIERDSEGFYIASVPELHGCHTQARSLDELMERIREAIALWLEVREEATARG